MTAGCCARPSRLVLVVLVVLGKQPSYSPRLLLASAIVGGVAGCGDERAVARDWRPFLPSDGTAVWRAGRPEHRPGICGRRTYSPRTPCSWRRSASAVRGYQRRVHGIGRSHRQPPGGRVLPRAHRPGGARGGGGLRRLRAGVRWGPPSGCSKLVRASEGVLTDTVFRMMSNVAPNPGASPAAGDPARAAGRRCTTPASSSWSCAAMRPAAAEDHRVRLFFDGTRWTTSHRCNRPS